MGSYFHPLQLLYRQQNVTSSSVLYLCFHRNVLISFILYFTQFSILNLMTAMPHMQVKIICIPFISQRSSIQRATPRELLLCSNDSRTDAYTVTITLTLKSLSSTFSYPTYTHYLRTLRPHYHLIQ